MGLAVLDDHEALARTARGFLAKRGAIAAARTALDGGPAVPTWWSDMAGLGWLGLHIPEEDGGSGFGLLELAVVVAEQGRTCCPGPFLPTAVAVGAISASGDRAQRRAFLPRILTGEVPLGLGLQGAGRPVLGAPIAHVLLIADGDDLVLVDREMRGVRVEERENIDPTRPSAVVHVEQWPTDPARRFAGAARCATRMLATLAAAEAAGGAAACREMAVDYAKVRQAFGRPIGQFQAVKHHCANMLVDEELATAAAWNSAMAGGDDAADTIDLAALATCLPAFLRCAQLNIQVHGGIGCTWEHDAHLFLRRATALIALAGPVDAVVAELAASSEAHAAKATALHLPGDAERVRGEVRDFRSAYEGAAEADRHRLVLDAGYLFPQLPAPWGRGAGAVEQLIVEQELGDLPLKAPLGPTGWTLPIVLPTIISHGTDRQKQRWLRPSLEGRLGWCQLLSEPGAGSDLAALSTRAVRADGGWLITGQKVWTSSAHQADVGFALVRTDPDAPKHRGITCMVIDMKAHGVTVRPLRQLTGHAEFNEVFFDDVFVPDHDVVGAVNGGWSVARTALGNEQVTIGDGGWGQDDTLRRVHVLAHRAVEQRPVRIHRLGELIAVALALRAMNLRSTLRAIEGSEGAFDAVITKLVSSEHSQRLADFGVRLLEEEALFLDGDDADLVELYLFSRSMTIAGGTSEMGRNMIAERVLGLPRDPLPSPDTSLATKSV